MTQKNILVGITGSIAAFKVCSLVSSLTKKGHAVQVVMTEHASQFVGPLTFAALSGRPVLVSEFDGNNQEMIPHIELARWADLVLVAPADANILAKAACGIADDLLSSLLLAAACPKVAAAAMNVHMYENRAVQRNIETLKQDGWTFIEPQSGMLACKEEGKGRLAEPEQLEKAILEILNENETSAEDIPQNTPPAAQSPQESLPETEPAESQTTSSQPQSEQEEAVMSELLDESLDSIHPLRGMHVLVSAGPTQESLDPVRFLTNHSSGKQGYAIAKDARKLGAQVILVSGPVSLEKPEGIEVVDVKSARQMQEAMNEHADWADFIIMCAAVGDYRPKTAAENKIKKSDGEMTVTFVRNPDILAGLGERKKHEQVLCGFAMETENLEANAQAKLKKKNCDLLVGNSLRTPGAGFQTETNVAVLLFPDGSRHLPMMSKESLGYVILAECLKLWKEKTNASVH